MIGIQGLWKVYGRGQAPAASDVSFEVGDGEVVGFVGLNGAGKTTTIRVAAGVSLPTKGTVSIDGFDVVKSKAKATERLGWVPEIPNFEPNSNSLQLMKYFCGFYGIPSSAAESKSRELLTSVGLEGAEGKKFRSYSQGMKKRFSLAVSLLSTPQNFLFDEILNGLDPEGIHYFRNTVVDLKKEGKAILLSSHILAEVQALADRVVFIHRGKVIKVLRVSEISPAIGGSIVVTVEDIDDRAIAQMREYGDVQVDGSRVRITSPKTDAAKVNSDLVSLGYKVSGVTQEKAVLEDEFFKLIQEAEGEGTG